MTEVSKFEPSQLSVYAHSVFLSPKYYHLLSILDKMPLPRKFGFKTFYRKLLIFLASRSHILGNIMSSPQGQENVVSPYVNFNDEMSFEYVQGFSIMSDVISLIFHNRSFCTLTIKNSNSSADEYVFTFKIIEFNYLIRLLLYLVAKRTFHQCPIKIFPPHMITMFNQLIWTLAKAYLIQEIKTTLIVSPILNASRAIQAVGLGIHFALSSVIERYAHEFYDGNNVIRKSINRDIYARRLHIYSIHTKTAWNFYPRSKTRFQTHCIISLPYPTDSDCHLLRRNFEALSMKLTPPEHEFWRRFISLPIEIQLQILVVFEPFRNLKSACQTITCNRPKHTMRCRRSISLFSSHTNILFPVLRRLSSGSNGHGYVDWYCILSTQNLFDPSDIDVKQEDNTILRSRFFDECLVMDPCHSQPSGGFMTLNNNALIHTDVTTRNTFIIKPLYPINVKMYSQSFKDGTHNLGYLDCPHRKEFVPRIQHQRDHLLVFN
jgi:hypothetical protein